MSNRTATKKTIGRVHVRRQPSRGHYDRDSIYEVLDAGLVAHAAFVDAGQPFCIPMLYARINDDVYVHGATKSRAVRVLGDGAPACLTVTLLDGLVLARSAFEHSANYRSVVVLGAFRRVEDDEARLAALAAFTNKIVPGRWEEVRKPSPQELKATVVLYMPLREASAKCRFGPPSDDGSADANLDIWAGVVPLRTTFGYAEPSPGLRSGISLPSSLELLVRDREFN